MRKVATEEWKGILVYLECHEGNIQSASLEMIGEASRLAAQSNEKVYAVGIGEYPEQIQEKLRGYPVSKAFLYESEDIYTPEVYEKIMISCIRELKPSVVLFGGTPEGRALAPGIAVAFETGLTADCTSLCMDAEGSLIQTRPAFGGNIMASIVTAYARPQLATVRPGVMEMPSICSQDSVECEIRKADHKQDKIKIKQIEKTETEDSITDQKILVVAGRGVSKKEDLEMLRELADLLGGRLASSRALVEKGWMSPKDQIGLSGNTVCPDYMVTCGVSGSVQFMAGMKNTKNIIAINTDPNARIFEIAHYPICGDLYEIVPKLIEKIKNSCDFKEKI